MREFEEWGESEKKKKLLRQCVEAIRKIEPSAKVILYGSRATGKYSIDSDYDLLVLSDDNVNLKKEDIFRQQLFPIELEEGCVVTVNVYNINQWNTPLYQAMPFHQNVEKDGVVL
ncbi:nucleotidyltransferase domain-containing protein [bacterium]|nr:nucleotidyltransferase domain-containing protein [bacterium]MBU1752726.1 nucleotidyltransferase domain-containing protein [bacterium]